MWKPEAGERVSEPAWLRPRQWRSAKSDQVVELSGTLSLQGLAGDKGFDFRF